VRENVSMPSVHATLSAAALGDELTENEASVRVFLTAGGLAVLGLALTLFTIWWWRGTKPEPPALGPLEVMSDRRWQTASESERMRMIDLHRPAGSFVMDGRMDPVPIDLSVLARDLPSGFDDLRDDPARWPAAQPELMQSSLSELLEGVGDSAVDDAAATAGPAGDARDDASPAASDADDDGPSETEPPPASLDETMYQVEAPAVLSPSANGDHDDQHDAHRADDQHDVPRDDPRGGDRSDELAIDPLLQRAASQD
jgi:hypothetical protein